MYVHKNDTFNAVTYQPILYLLVAISIDYIAMPCLEIDIRRRVASFLK